MRPPCAPRCFKHDLIDLHSLYRVESYRTEEVRVLIPDSEWRNIEWVVPPISARRPSGLSDRRTRIRADGRVFPFWSGRLAGVRSPQSAALLRAARLPLGFRCSRVGSRVVILRSRPGTCRGDPETCQGSIPLVQSSSRGIAADPLRAGEAFRPPRRLRKEASVEQSGLHPSRSTIHQ
jgi:hypothetical protein